MIGTGVGTAILGAAGDFFAQPGVLLVTAIAAGIPLTFLVIHILLGAFGYDPDPGHTPTDPDAPLAVDDEYHDLDN